MKLLISALVVANLLLLGWLRGWMAPFGGDGREPARVERQVEPQRLRIVQTPRPAGEASGDRGGTTDAPAAQARDSAPAAAPGDAPAPAPPAPTAPSSGAPSDAALIASLRASRCAELGPMGEPDLVRLQVALEAIRDDLAFAVRRADETTSWWVYLAPSPVDTARRLADLRGRGVTDTYVMPDGAWRGAISLGLFRQEDLAVALQRSIAGRGVKGVRVAPRGPGAGRFTMQVRPMPEPVAAELVRQRGVGPDTVPRPCPAG